MECSYKLFLTQDHSSKGRSSLTLSNAKICTKAKLLTYTCYGKTLWLIHAVSIQGQTWKVYLTVFILFEALITRVAHLPGVTLGVGRYCLNGPGLISTPINTRACICCMNVRPAGRLMSTFLWYKVETPSQHEYQLTLLILIWRKGEMREKKKNYQKSLLFFFNNTNPCLLFSDVLSTFQARLDHWKWRHTGKNNRQQEKKILYSESRPVHSNRSTKIDCFGNMCTSVWMHKCEWSCLQHWGHHLSFPNTLTFKDVLPRFWTIWRPISEHFSLEHHFFYMKNGKQMP